MLARHYTTGGTRPPFFPLGEYGPLIGTFCKTKIAIFVKARGRGAKKWRMFANIHTKVRVDGRLREQIFRFEIGLSWGESSGSAGSERWFGWFFPFNWICQHFFFTIEIWTSVMFSWSTFGLCWVACRMAFWTWCSSRRPSIQFELAMDLILRLRVGRAAHQLFFVDVTVFMREQSEKREVRKSSTATEQETTPKSWSQTVQTTRRGCQTDRSKLHTPPAAIAMINSPIEQKLQFSVCKTTRRFAGPSLLSCVLKPSFTKICIRISLCKTSLLIYRFVRCTVKTFLKATYTVNKVREDKDLAHCMRELSLPTASWVRRPRCSTVGEGGGGGGGGRGLCAMFIRQKKKSQCDLVLGFISISLSYSFVVIFKNYHYLGIPQQRY